MAEDLGLWLIDGLISKETYDLLRQRYDGRRLGLARAIRFCGIGGGMLAFFGLLGLAGAAVGSALFGAMLLLAVGAGLTTWGIRLSLDPLGRNTMSADVLLVLGMVSGIGGVAVACQAFGWQDTRLLRITGTLTLPILFVLAYRYRNIFLLILGLMGLFHWVGTWTAMFGQSTYEISIQDPRLMSVAALVAVGLGIYHELRLTERTGRFYQAYEALGLVYLNLSLLIMTIFPEWGPPPVWMVVLTAASIGQIVLGAASQRIVYRLRRHGVCRQSLHPLFRTVLGEHAAGDILHRRRSVAVRGGARLRNVAQTIAEQAGMRQASNRKIAAELDDLGLLGVLTAEQCRQLKKRYPVENWDVLVLVRWFTILGGVTAGVGFVLAAREIFNVVRLTEALLVFATVGLILLASWMRRARGLDKSATAVEMMSGFALQGLTFALAIDFSSGSNNWPALVGVQALLLTALAYLLQNRLILIHAAVCFFIFFGGETGYVSGWGAYWLKMNYPVRYVAAGLLFLAVAWAHAYFRRGAYQSFAGLRSSGPADYPPGTLVPLALRLLRGTNHLGQQHGAARRL